MKWFLSQAEYDELLHMQQAFEHEHGERMNFDDVKIDYAKLQADFASRGKRDCDCCERLPYSFDHYDRALTYTDNEANRRAKIDLLLANDWEELAYRRGYILRCASCKNAPPTFAWIADIDPVLFAMFVQARDEQNAGAWWLDDLKVLLGQQGVTTPFRTAVELKTDLLMKSMEILKTATRLMPHVTGTLTPPCEADLLPFRNFVPGRKGFEFL